MVVTTILFAHTTFLWATCCLKCFIPIVKPFLTHWSWLRVVPSIERGNRAHGGCDRSTGGAYSSMAPDPTSDIYSEVCVRPFSDLYFLLDLRDWLLIVIFVISCLHACQIWNVKWKRYVLMILSSSVQNFIVSYTPFMHVLYAAFVCYARSEVSSLSLGYFTQCDNEPHNKWIKIISSKSKWTVLFC
jgi:hypothetical protein